MFTFGRTSRIEGRIYLDAHEHALALAADGWLASAERILRRIHQADPRDASAATNLGIVLLAKGQYAEGARLYEARHEPPAPLPRLPFPRWDGTDLGGKSVLVWPEQGLGDQLMFARFVPELRKRDCEVTVVCHPALQALLAANLDALVLPASGQIDFPDPDVWLFAGSLLAASGATLETLPNRPYLQAPRTRKVSARIGVATRGSPTHQNDANRSLPAELAAELLALPGAVSLLPEDTGAADFAETAGLVAGLDLVISVDTSIAHLAGAMGKPVWILLPEQKTDWRWMRGREDSPWYPSARLFRQTAAGEWGPVIAQVRSRLSQFA